MKNILDKLSRINWISSLDEESIFKKYSISFGVDGHESPAAWDGFQVKQVHGTTILNVDDKSKELTKNIEADGIFTTKNHKIGIKTADCLPLLLSDSKKTGAMSLHAGWRGLFAGIVTRGCQLFESELGLTSENLIAFIGPCISLDAFEVGPEVLDLFFKQVSLSDMEYALCLQKGKGDRWHIDLATVCVLQLLQSGLKPEHISVLRSCTYKNLEWSSFRRDKHCHQLNYTWVRL